MNAIETVDELVREYLLFRGFLTTLKHFEAEKRQDQLKGFQVQKVADYLLQCAAERNLSELSQFWKLLEDKFFSQMDTPILLQAKDILHALLKRYLVCCHVSNETKKIKDFFEAVTVDASYDERWKPWFVFPFIADPEQRPEFAPFFSKKWLEILESSLQNYIAAVFSNTPLPKILNFDVDRLTRLSLEHENESLNVELERIRRELEVKTEVMINMQQQIAAQSEHAAERSRGYSLRESMAAHGTPVLGGIAMQQQQQQQQAAQGQGSLQPQQSQQQQQQQQQQTLSPAQQLQAADANVEAPVTLREFSSAEKQRIFSVQQHTVFSDHGKPVNCCRLSPNCQLIASASADCTVRVWSDDIDSNSMLIFGSEVVSLQWAGEKTLLCGTSNRNIRIYNVQRKNVLLDLLCPESVPIVTDFAVDMGGTRFAACSRGSAGGALQLWSMRTGVLERLLGGATSGAAASAAADAQQGGAAATASYLSCAFNHNGSMLVAGCADGAIRVFDGHRVTEIGDWHGSRSPVSAVRFLPSETCVMSASHDGSIALWSLRMKGRAERRFKLPLSDPEMLRIAALPRGIEFALDVDGETAVTSSPTSTSFLFETGGVGSRGVPQHGGGGSDTDSAGKGERVSGSGGDNNGDSDDDDESLTLPFQTIDAAVGPVASVDWGLQNVVALACGNSVRLVSLGQN